MIEKRKTINVTRKSRIQKIERKEGETAYLFNLDITGSLLLVKKNRTQKPQKAKQLRGETLSFYSILTFLANVSVWGKIAQKNDM